MTVSTIICTYRRNDELTTALESLTAHDSRSMEVLVVDGGENSAKEVVQSASTGFDRTTLRHVSSPTGLTRQRNIGLEAAGGDIICFLDDDVAVPSDFIEQIVGVFKRDTGKHIAGLTGYDVCNYPAQLTLRWKVRRALGIVPTLHLGNVDRYGRPVPLSFAKPFEGVVDVGWLPGFCMAYRRDAIGDLRFDEELPTYAGEDRDFSIRVRQNGRLVMKGDLRVEHRTTPANRLPNVDRVFQTGFGVGRGLAKRATGPASQVVLWQTIVGETLVDGLGVLRQPSTTGLRAVRARARGIYQGWRSLRSVTQ